MLSGSIAYQSLRGESPTTITAVKAVLDKHPWYPNQWKKELDKVPESQRDEILFMLAARWADEIRNGPDKSQDRGRWHYINYRFKPDSQPANVQPQPPHNVNILTALAENERMAKTDGDPTRRAIALTWLFHLVGDVHQPLHTAQLFTTDYPNGDRGGNLVCVRVKESTQAIDLHRFWDGLISTSSNLTRLKNEARTLRNRPEFSKGQLTELAATDYQSWAKESFQIAAAIAYQNGALTGNPKGHRRYCSEVVDANVIPNGYTRTAGRIAHRRITLAGYRLAALFKSVTAN